MKETKLKERKLKDNQFSSKEKTDADGESLEERKFDKVSFFQPIPKSQSLVPLIPHFKGVCPNC